MQKDAFKPIGREISVMGMGSPAVQGGNQRMVPMAMPPPQGRQQQPAAASVMRGATPVSDRASAFKPMGQPVRMAGGAVPVLDGGAVDRGAAFQPSQPAALVPGPQAEMAAPPQQPQLAPRPFLSREPSDPTVFRVTMRGRMADGSEYASVYDAVMPSGAQPVDLSYVPLT
jgi:hypothetical protein